MTYPPADRVTPIDGDNHRHPPRWDEAIKALEARVAELEASEALLHLPRQPGLLPFGALWTRLRIWLFERKSP